MNQEGFEDELASNSSSGGTEFSRAENPLNSGLTSVQRDRSSRQPSVDMPVPHRRPPPRASAEPVPIESVMKPSTTTPGTDSTSGARQPPPKRGPFVFNEAPVRDSTQSVSSVPERTPIRNTPSESSMAVTKTPVSRPPPVQSKVTGATPPTQRPQPRKGEGEENVSMGKTPVRRPPPATEVKGTPGAPAQRPPPSPGKDQGVESTPTRTPVSRPPPSGETKSAATPPKVRPSPSSERAKSESVPSQLPAHRPPPKRGEEKVRASPEWTPNQIKKDEERPAVQPSQHTPSPVAEQPPPPPPERKGTQRFAPGSMTSDQNSSSAAVAAPESSTTVERKTTEQDNNKPATAATTSVAAAQPAHKKVLALDSDDEFQSDEGEEVFQFPASKKAQQTITQKAVQEPAPQPAVPISNKAALEPKAAAVPTDEARSKSPARASERIEEKKEEPVSPPPKQTATESDPAAGRKKEEENKNKASTSEPPSPQQRSPEKKREEQTTPPPAKQQKDESRSEARTPSPGKQTNHQEAEESEDKGMDFSFQPMEDILEKEDKTGVRHHQSADKMSRKTLDRLSKPRVQPKKSVAWTVGGRGVSPPMKHGATGAHANATSMPYVEASSSRVGGEGFHRADSFGVRSSASGGTPQRGGSRFGQPPPKGGRASSPGSNNNNIQHSDLCHVHVHALGNVHRIAIDRRRPILQILLELPLPRDGGRFTMNGIPVHHRASAMGLGFRPGNTVYHIKYCSPVEDEEASVRQDIILEQVQSFGNLQASLMVTLTRSRDRVVGAFMNAAGDYVDADLSESGEDAIEVVDVDDSQYDTFSLQRHSGRGSESVGVVSRKEATEINSVYL